MIGRIQLSIIIPYYKSWDSLNKLLKSIPASEILEVIVINDCSDNLEELLSNFSGLNLHVLDMPEGKRWAGAARNTGIKNAGGNYLLFADSDDYFVAHWLSQVERYLESSYDIVYYSPSSINIETGRPSNRHLRYADLVKNYLDNDDPSIRYKFYVPWSKLISRDFIIKNNIEFDEVQASNDINFSLKCGFYANNIAVVDQVIYCVTESSDSLTKLKSESVIDSRFNALLDYNKFLLQHDLDNYMVPMLLPVFQSIRFGFYKFLYRYFYCKYHGFPIFYRLSELFDKILR